jgi:hypothetical protein
MSTKYTGGFITKNPVAPTSSAASGIWTLDQQQQAQKAGTWPSPPIFIEDLFSTYLYTGTGGTAQTINNGIDLSTKGGLVWVKSRSNAYAGGLQDTARGASFQLIPSQTVAQYNNSGNGFTSFNTNGFSLQNDYSFDGSCNNTGSTYVSWTFAEQAKFFDIVTYTGNGASSQTINHNLGSVPGCIIVKGTSGSTNWPVYHRSMDATPQDYYMILDGTTAKSNAVANWGNTAPTSTQFTVGGNNNGNGTTFVAYLFAHDAGGFPVSGGGSTNGISCGSFTSDGVTNIPITLGYEPQWIMIKKSSGIGNWFLLDTTRRWNLTDNDAILAANLTNSEADFSGQYGNPTATGFVVIPDNIGAGTFIYMAIRRGPMKPPTVGTSVFAPNAYTGNSTNTAITSTGFPPDLFFSKIRQTDSGFQNMIFDKLRGAGQYLIPTTSGAEGASSNIQLSFDMTGVTLGVGSNVNNSGSTYAQWNFRRAPGFFDEVCYTGTGVAGLAVTHNLGVVPELMIIKTRTPFSSSWIVYTAPTGNAGALYLSSADALETAGGPGYFNNTTPTATQFIVGNYTSTNAGGLVAYLFATLAGVSKVGSYTGTGALQTVNCGFTSGARFVLIKRTDSTGGWFTYDSARGITSGDDPYLLINSIAAEVTNTNYVDTDTTGFKVTAAAPAALNASGGNYIFLAIA